jgi:excisionase family DNA binding protein
LKFQVIIPSKSPFGKTAFVSAELVGEIRFRPLTYLQYYDKIRIEQKPRGGKRTRPGNDVCGQLKQEGDMAEEKMLEEEMIILTAKEAAEYLRVSLYTLKRMESEGGLIPFRTPGGHRRYSLRMLDEYLEKSRQFPRSPESESEAEAQ